MAQSNEKKDRLPIFRQRLNELLGDMSTTEFAEKVGLSRQTMGFYLNGDRIPDAETLLRICEKCNISSDWLLGITNDRNRQPCAVDELGLSPKIIDTIKEWHEYYDEDCSNSLDGLNMFLEATLESPLYEMITCFASHVNSESSASDPAILLYELVKQVNKDVPPLYPEDDSNTGYYNRLTDTAKDTSIGWRLARILANLYPETRGRISVTFGSQTLEPEFNAICSFLRRCLENITGYREYLDNLS